MMEGPITFSSMTGIEWLVQEGGEFAHDKGRLY
jgi:hypothetical protein